MGLFSYLVSCTVGFALSIILNILDRFLSIFSKSFKKDPKVISVQVGEKKKGETRPFRHPAAKGGFLKTSVEGKETLPELWENAVKLYADRPCMGKRDLVRVHEKEIVNDGRKKIWKTPEFGKLYWKTYAEIGYRVKNFTNGLVHFTQAKEGSFVGIYERTRPKWMISALACWKNNYTVVTVYANLGEDALVYSINQTEMTAIVCNADKVRTLIKLSEAKKIPTLKYIIYLDTLKDVDSLKNSSIIKIISHKSVEELGEQKTTKTMKQPTKDETAVIMYTSGSTGYPKGVIIRHSNLCSMTASFNFFLNGVKKGDVHLGYLPLAHIFEMAMETSLLSLGGSIGYGGPRTLTDKGAKPYGDLSAVKPTIMAGVPRVYDTIKKAVEEKIKYGSAITKWIFSQAYAAKERALLAGRDTPLWNSLVFKKFKNLLGGRAKLLISGGAPLSPDTQKFLKVCFGASVVQGYGLTETTAASTIQLQTSAEVKKVGGPIVSCEIKLVDVPDMGYFSTDKPPRGEVLVRGLNITGGYFKNPEKTKEVYGKDGWFSTGDIGSFSNGTLAIIDRKKNLVKMNHGEYVALKSLEMIYGDSPFVSPNGICVYGDSYQDNVVGLIIPQKTYCEKWAKDNGFDVSDYDALLKDEKFKKAVLKNFEQIAILKKKKRFEHLKDICLYNEEWTPENEMLTAAMKLKRANIVKHYKKDIDEMYKKMKK